MDSLAAVSMEVLERSWELLADTAPWVFIGLAAAGLIGGLAPKNFIKRVLGGNGVGAVLKAAMVGAPLPLCSCSVLPTALGLHREGASKGATVSFLVSTPETSVDSILVSYGLLGPVFAVVRPVVAVFTALAAGIGVNLLPDSANASPAAGKDADCSGDSCGCSCESESEKNESAGTGFYARFLDKPVDLLGDIGPSLLLGILAAGLIAVLVPQSVFISAGTGVTGLLFMLAVGLPIYVCASASTPLALAFLQMGVSPGAALVFLLAGPATNAAGMAVIARELGGRVLAVYLASIALCAVAAGFALDALAPGLASTFTGQVEAAHHAVSAAGAVAAVALVGVIAFLRIAPKLKSGGAANLPGGEPSGA